jgi:2,3-bisphosphoglycerate-dependent phosphoglycerate mutase
MTLYLIRHAHSQRTALPAEAWALSEPGIRQARKLAELPFWREVQIICSSWEPKALQTAQIVAEQHSLPIEPVFDLRELRRTEGVVADYEAAVHEVLKNTFKSHHGWEPAGEAQTRTVTAIERLLMLHEGETLAVVSHGLVLTLYLAYLTDTPPTLDLWQSFPFASATQVDPEARTVLNRFTI